MKLWKWERENLPSVIHSIRTAIAATISLGVARLFGLPEAYLAAIVTLVVMQSTLSATLLISIRTHCRDGAGCSGRRSRGKLFPRESFGVRSGGICAGALVRSISHGENRVSVCGRHARHYRAYSASTRCMDHCASPLLRSLGWNPSRADARGRLAGASTRIRKTKR
jgi:hypothetical protein